MNSSRHHQLVSSCLRADWTKYGVVMAASTDFGRTPHSIRDSGGPGDS